MSNLQAAQFSSNVRKSSRNGSSDLDGISVSYLYSLVKQYDKDFVPGKDVNPALLNDDGTPRVFYHGTASQFDTFEMKPGAYGSGAYFTTSTAEAADYAIAALEAAGIEVPSDYDDIEDWLFENGYIREYYLNVPESQIFSSKYGGDELVAMITDSSQAKSATVNKSYNFKEMETKAPKTESGIRIVPVPDKLIPILAEHKSKGNVFKTVNKNKQMTQQAWRRLKDTIEYSSGVKFEWHQLRHTYASVLYTAGVDVLTASKILGHADVKTTMAIYTHLEESKKRLSIDKLNEFLA